jgi:penicillin amidase
MLDDQDLFFEKLDGTGERYLRGADWKPIEKTEETIRIRGGGTRTLALRSTDVGPLFEADAARGLPPRSLAWTGYHGGDPLAMLIELPRAATPEELYAAAEPFVCPSQNLVAAFDSGAILFTVIGHVPQRRRGDGRLPSPGWDPGYGWDGLRPRRANPTVLDPEDGVLVTANDDVVPPDYPLPFVADFFPGHRSKRIRDVLLARAAWDWEGAGELQNDVVSLYACDVLDALAGELEGEAGRALADWRCEMTPRGPSALYILFERELLGVFADEAEAAGVSGLTAFDARGLLLRLLRRELSPKWFDDVRTDAVEGRSEAVSKALGAAWEKGRGRWGADVSRWSFGELHRLTLAHDLDAVPLLGWWMRRGPFEVPGSATTVAAFGASWRGDRMEVVYGPSMRWIVDWGQPDMAFAMLPGGQSGHPADPHYDDQVAPFLAGRLRPAPWSEEQIEAVKVTSLRLVPGG